MQTGYAFVGPLGDHACLPAGVLQDGVGAGASLFDGPARVAFGVEHPPDIACGGLTAGRLALSRHVRRAGSGAGVGCRRRSSPLPPGGQKGEGAAPSSMPSEAGAGTP